MSLVSSIAIYVVIWWLVLFAVLPWGIRNQHESGVRDDVADVAAPVNPALWRKVFVTTVISAGLFALVYAAFTGGYISLADLPVPFEFPERPDQSMPAS